MVEFRDVYYLLYHNRPVEKAMGISGNYRSPQIDVMHVNEDGSIRPVKGTMKGVSQLHPLDPYAPVSAQTMYREAGIEVTGYGPDALTVADTGDWLQLRGVDFGDGCGSITLRAGSQGGGAVRFVTDAPDGTVLGDVLIPAGGMQEFTFDCTVSGVHDLYLLFVGDVQADWWQAR